MSGIRKGVSRRSLVAGEIITVQKSFKAEWKDATPNSGYYWRLTATTATPVLPGVNTCPSPPANRASSPDWEFAYLRQSVTTDPAFLTIHAENARRAWCPIWCLERGLACAGMQWICAPGFPWRRTSLTISRRVIPGTAQSTRDVFPGIVTPECSNRRRPQSRYRRSSRLLL